MDHTRAGSMVVTTSEWTYSHRHSTVAALHRWSKGRTDGQSGRGITELQTWKELRLAVGQCLRNGAPVRAIICYLFSHLRGTPHTALKTCLNCFLNHRLKNKNNQLPFLKFPQMFNSVILGTNQGPNLKV